MADLLKNVFGGNQPEAPVANPDSDFADFASAPEPVPEPAAAAPGAATLSGAGARSTAAGVPWTKWYNVHERHSLSEFKAEGLVLGFAVVILVFHLLGSRANRSKAKAWAKANDAALKSEFALVGFGGAAAADADVMSTESHLKEKSLFEFASYASGRQNTAFMDVKITLTKKFNPFLNIIEMVAAFVSDSFTAPHDAVEATIFPFDGKESVTVPSAGPETRSKDGKSTFEGFVWAIVNKDRMQKLRDDRYDVSLTSTKENSKLPNWLTVMSESAEVTNMMLTNELADAVKQAGESFDYLIITDQPSVRPITLEDTAPRKRLILKYRLPSDSKYESLLPIFSYFMRIPDQLVEQAHFRPEVMKKMRVTRDNMIAQIKKAAEEEKNEERLFEKDKARKAKREADLKGLDAKAQKKYLEKEREKELRKSQKKQTVRG